MVLETASNEKLLMFKIACKADFIDEKHMEKLFLNFNIEEEFEIEELLNYLETFRPVLFNKYARQLL